MEIKPAIAEYLVEIELKRYTQKTIRSYSTNLHGFERFCASLNVTDLEGITQSVVKRYAAYYVRLGRKGTYINGLLKTVKSFLQWAYTEGYGGYSTKGTFPWVKAEKPHIVAFKPEQVRRMMANCGGNDFLALRDKAILTTLFDAGVRCWELCCIKPEDVHDDFILITSGKNHKMRSVPVTPVMRKALMRYERSRAGKFALKSTDEYYFLSCHGRQLTNAAVEHIVKRRAEGIDPDGVRISPHTCRHFFAQQQVKMGTDIYTISRLLRHESIQITQTYLNSLRERDIVEMNKNRSVLLSL